MHFQIVPIIFDRNDRTKIKFHHRDLAPGTPAPPIPPERSLATALTTATSHSQRSGWADYD